MSEHRLSIFAHSLGTKPIRGFNTPTKGTTARCSCGWTYRNNDEPPSRGGREAATEKWGQHLIEVINEREDELRSIADAGQPDPNNTKQAPPVKITPELGEAAMRLAAVVANRSEDYIDDLIMREVERRAQHIGAVWLTTSIKPPKGSTPHLAAIESVYHDVCRGVL